MISVQVTNRKQNLKFEHSGGPLEFGRGPRRDVERFVLNDVFASRDQLRVEELPSQRLRVENLSLKQEVQLGDERCLAAGARQEFALPVRLKAGQTALEFEWVSVDSFDRASLLTIDGPAEVAGAARARLSLDELGEAPTPAHLVQWFEAIIAAQRPATSSALFYEQTARILVELVGLDLGMVLLRRDWTWEVAARHAADATASAQFSPALLSHVVAERRTFYQDMTGAAPPARGLGPSDSGEALVDPGYPSPPAKGLALQGVDAVVVAPIFGLHDDMVGAVYGLRNPRFPARGGKISPLEAQVVQLLAATVGGHLSRARAARTRLAYEQAFAPRVIREIERDSTLLEGRQQDVTLLVSGLDDFGGLVEQLGPENAYRLVRELLDRQEDKVFQANGVLVEVGEAGLVALWNAPLRQQDHFFLAAGAALAMLAETPELSDHWQALLGRPLQVHIGLHAGAAHVGSLGGRQKFKYGATGPAVFLGSQVAQAARKLRVPVLLTEAVREGLPDTFAVRRLGRARLAGASGPVALFELHGVHAPPEWLSWRDAYEYALTLFEARRWAEACQALSPLTEHTATDDVPALKLMRQALKCREAAADQVDPVLEL